MPIYYARVTPNKTLKHINSRSYKINVFLIAHRIEN